MLSERERTAVEYPASDGEPMAETGFHVTLIAYLISMLRAFFYRRSDVYVGGNMFLYYEEGDPAQRVAPDVFVVFGTSRRERRSWFTWQEDRQPGVIFEITSRSTRAADLGPKKGLYEWLGVEEYFLFDPLGDYLQPPLQGFRLTGGTYQPLTLVDGQLESQMLGLRLQPDRGLLRLFNSQTGEEVPPPTEMLGALEEARHQAREAQAQSQQEKAARLAAEAEVTRLREELARLRGEK